MNEAERKAALEELRTEQIAKDKSFYDGLHVCKRLTNNATFHRRENGLGDSFEGKLVMWQSGSRIDGRPNKRTKKSEICCYREQDAVDALLSLANIAEKVAPYAWGADPHPMAPERGWVGSAGKGNKVLVDEAGSFLDRFGFPHMRADGLGPGTRKVTPRRESLRLSASFEEEQKAEFASFVEYLDKHGDEHSRDSYKRRLKQDGLYVEGDTKATSERIFFDGMRSIAKDFSGYSGLGKEIAELKKDQLKLEEARREVVSKRNSEGVNKDGSVNEDIYDRSFVEERCIANEVAQLHLDKGVLLQACEKAFNGFSEEERELLQTSGYVLPDIDELYRIGLLFHDAIELHSAIHGDNEAFERVLTKVHMELFEAEGGSVGDLASRYTMWFESCGYDNLNPGSNLNRDSFEVEVSGFPVELKRQGWYWGGRDNYGCGRVVHVLCDPGETPKQFRQVAKKNLQVFLDGLIEEGISLNYKGLLAEPAKVDPKDPAIVVNDFGTDLTRTLWVVMDLIDKEEIPFAVSRCKCCGRLMNTAREAGNSREFCDSSCRSLHRKRVASQEKSGKEHKDARVRREFKEYMESGKAIHVGMASHMGPEMQPEPEPLTFMEKIQRGFEGLVVDGLERVLG